MENTNDQNTQPFKMIGNWNDQSLKLKAKYEQLSVDDLRYEKGKEEDMLARVGKRLNKERDEVVNIIKKVQPANTI